MATKSICDGTGVEIAADTPPTGLHGRQYCDEAREVAEEYLRLLDEAHTTAARAYETARQALRDAFHVKLTHLPDEPQ